MHTHMLNKANDDRNRSREQWRRIKSAVNSNHVIVRELKLLMLLKVYLCDAYLIELVPICSSSRSPRRPCGVSCIPHTHTHTHLRRPTDTFSVFAERKRKSKFALVVG